MPVCKLVMFFAWILEVAAYYYRVLKSFFNLVFGYLDLSFPSFNIQFLSPLPIFSAWSPIR